jgi:chromosome partitioning protein
MQEWLYFVILRFCIHFPNFRQSSVVLSRRDIDRAWGILRGMGNPARSFQAWIDIIKQTVLTEFVPSLANMGMSITPSEFDASKPEDTAFNLINISDFNSLIALSQKYNVPVFDLTDAQLEQAGHALFNMKNNRNDFRAAFEALAQSVELLAKV